MAPCVCVCRLPFHANTRIDSMLALQYVVDGLQIDKDLKRTSRSHSQHFFRCHVELEPQQFWLLTSQPVNRVNRSLQNHSTCENHAFSNDAYLRILFVVVFCRRLQLHCKIQLLCCHLLSAMQMSFCKMAECCFHAKIAQCLQNFCWIWWRNSDEYWQNFVLTCNQTFIIVWKFNVQNWSWLV